MAKVSEHKSAPLIITDFETSGLDMATHAITEIAILAIRSDNGEEIGRYESFITPYEAKYDKKAEEVTGITKALLTKQGKPLDVVAKEVIEFLKKINIFNSTGQHKPIMVAHNAPFEVQCYQHLFCKTGNQKEFDKCFQGMTDFHGNFHPAYIDTLQFSRLTHANNPRVLSYSLETTCERAGIELPDGHRAMNDVIPTKEYVKQTIKQLRSQAIVDLEIDKGLSFRKDFKFQF